MKLYVWKHVSEGDGHGTIIIMAPCLSDAISKGRAEFDKHIFAEMHRSPTEELEEATAMFIYQGE